jgi:hypothetical protein
MTDSGTPYDAPPPPRYLVRSRADADRVWLAGQERADALELRARQEPEGERRRALMRSACLLRGQFCPEDPSASRARSA